MMEESECYRFSLGLFLQQEEKCLVFPKKHFCKHIYIFLCYTPRFLLMLNLYLLFSSVPLFLWYFLKKKNQSILNVCQLLFKFKYFVLVSITINNYEINISKSRSVYDTM